MSAFERCSWRALWPVLMLVAQVSPAAAQPGAAQLGDAQLGDAQPEAVQLGDRQPRDRQPSAAQRPDAAAQWARASEAERRSFVVRHTVRSPRRLLALETRTDQGRMRVLERGSVHDADGQVVGLFEAHFEGQDYTATEVESASGWPESAGDAVRRADFERCDAALARCRAAAASAYAHRRCGAAAEACVFGRPTLFESAGARLRLLGPLPDRGDSEREAELEWRGHSLHLRVPAHNTVDHGWATRVSGGLSLARLSPRREVLVLAMTESGDEDPPSRRRYFLVRGEGSPAARLVEIADSTIANTRYGSRLPGDGTIRVRRGGWDDCQREGYPPRAPRTEVVVRVDDAGRVRSARRRRLRGGWDCHELPACPYVDVIGSDGRARRAGEILRNVRVRPETRSLPLGLLAGRVRLRVVEEKPEVTWLDHVALQVGEVSLAPLACVADGSLEYCAADGESLVLREGESLELVFVLPPGPPRAVSLVATGMYRPVDAPATDRRR